MANYRLPQSGLDPSNVAGREQLALLGLNKETILEEATEQGPDMFLMLLRRLGENEHITQIHKHKPVENMPQHIINEGLEDL